MEINHSFLILLFVSIFLIACKQEAKSEVKTSLEQSQASKQFLDSLSPDLIPQNYSDYSKYADKVCRDFILPQWEVSPDINSALSQMEGLMGQINARLYQQKDIGFGWFVYYYDIGSGDVSYLKVPRFDYLLEDSPRSELYPGHIKNEIRDLKSFGMVESMQLDYQRSFSSFVMVDKEGKPGFAVTIKHAHNLEKYFTEKKLQNAPDFIVALLAADFKTGPRRYSDPKTWTFLRSERRDGFSYVYRVYFNPYIQRVYKNSQGQDIVPIESLSIELAFDGVRQSDKRLSNIVLRKTKCNFVPELPPAYREQYALFKGRVYKPEPPIFMKPCGDNQQWFYCYVHPVSERYRGTERSCKRFNQTEPVCPLSND